MGATESIVLLASVLKGAVLTVRGASGLPQPSRELCHGVAFLVLALGFYMRFAAAKWMLAAWSARDCVAYVAGLFPVVGLARNAGAVPWWLSLLEPGLVAMLVCIALLLRIIERASLQFGGNPIKESSLS